MNSGTSYQHGDDLNDHHYSSNSSRSSNECSSSTTFHHHNVKRRIGIIHTRTTTTTTTTILLAMCVILAGSYCLLKNVNLPSPSSSLGIKEETSAAALLPEGEEDVLLGKKKHVTDDDDDNNHHITTHAIIKDKYYDVVIVGGSISGLSAALCLGRSLRHVLVIDAGHPCNTPSPHAQNLLGFEQIPSYHHHSMIYGNNNHRDDGGIPPTHLHEISKSNVAAYPTVELVTGIVTKIDVATDKKDDTNNDKKNNDDPHFYPISARFNNDTVVQARKLIIATGVQDLLPPIIGLKECWGKTAIHCPYCDGYEFRNRKTALVHIEPATAYAFAAIISELASELTIIGNYDDNTSFTLEQLDQFKRHGINLLLRRNVVEIQHTDGILEYLRLDNGEIINMDVIYVRPPHQQAPVISTIPLPLNEKGYIEVDPVTQKTPLPHVFAVGDCTDSNRALSIAMASGTRAAKMMNYELAMEDWKTEY